MMFSTTPFHEPYFITMKNNHTKTATCPICCKQKTISYKIFCINSINNYTDYFMARYCLCCSIIFSISHKFKKDTYYSYLIKDQIWNAAQLNDLVNDKKIKNITFTCTCNNANCEKNIILTDIEWICYNDPNLCYDSGKMTKPAIKY